jgi:hypothetical protein
MQSWLSRTEDTSARSRRAPADRLWQRGCSRKYSLAEDRCSVNLVEILLMMESESGRQRTEHHRTHPSRTYGMVTLALLLGNVVSIESSHLTWAAVYECVDAAGKPVLTNKPAQLHNCHMLSEDMNSELTPSEASTPPEVSPLPIRPDRLHPPSHVPPMPPSNVPSPCAPGINPLNPLSSPPCVRPDQSEAQPLQPAPSPSP